MIKVDTRVSHALRRLQAPEFEPLVTALQNNVDANLTALVSAIDTDQIRLLQGETRFLQNLLKLIGNAEGLIEKTKAS